MLSINKHILYPVFVFLVLVVGCGKGSGSSPDEKAEILSHRAEEYRNKSNFVMAERSIAEAIELYSAISSERKLIESYSVLAQIQEQSGKISASLQSLATVKDLYAGIGEREAEVRTMIHIGILNTQIHNFDAALSILREAKLNSELFQLKKQYTQSLFRLGMVYSRLFKYEHASSYFARSSAQFLLENDLSGTMDAIAENIHSLLKFDKTEEANRYLTQYENIILTNRSVINISEAYSKCGFAFLNNGQWEIAKACFEKAAVSPFFSTIDGAVRINPPLGIGEVLYNNFSYSDAQQYFLKAYAIAKNHSNSLTQAYLMVRIADCEMKKTISGMTQENSIRALQFYEHALNLFNRADNPFGDAIVLHRIGMLQELLQNENSAITYYKRAFEKFSNESIRKSSYLLSYDLFLLTRTHLNESDTYHWFSNQLIQLLLRQKKYSEALDYVERSRSFRIRDELLRQNLIFRDKTKDSLFTIWNKSYSSQQRLGLELTSIDKNSDNEYFLRLQQQFFAARKLSDSSQRSMIKEFPELSIIKSEPISFRSIPPASTVLRFYFNEQEAWVFVLQDEKGIVAVKLSSFGMILANSMTRYMEQLFDKKIPSSKKEALSENLYQLLIRPIEQYGIQRFIIIPPDNFKKFPYHMLTKNGKPLIEMIEVSYLPSVSSLNKNHAMPQIISNIAAFGFSSDSRWGLEFELRDIRSFNRNAHIFVNQSATLPKLEQTMGEVLHLSSRFRTSVDNDQSFTLSDGTASLTGFAVPISQFTALHNFPIVVLNDIHATDNSISDQHSLLWLINGSAAVITNEFPLTPKTSKQFIETFYPAYTSTMDPYQAYRKALMTLNTLRQPTESSIAASYFYYGK